MAPIPRHDSFQTLIGDLADKNQVDGLNKVVPFTCQRQNFGWSQFFFTVTTSAPDLCMIQTRAQAMANEKIDTLEQSQRASRGNNRRHMILMKTLKVILAIFFTSM